ncbi:MAG: hypothetical protein ABIP42_18310 [Planctomycetota bacterium]
MLESGMKAVMPNAGDWAGWCLAAAAAAALVHGCHRNEQPASANGITAAQSGPGENSKLRSVGECQVSVEIAPELATDSTRGIVTSLGQYSVSSDWIQDRRTILLSPCDISCSSEMFSISITPKDLHDLTAGVDVTHQVSFSSSHRPSDGTEPITRWDEMTTREVRGTLRASHADATRLPLTLQFDFKFRIEQGSGLGRRIWGTVSVPQ